MIVKTDRPGNQAECIRIVHAVYRASGGAPMLDLGCRSAQLTRDLEGSWVEIDPQPDTPVSAVIMDLREAPEYYKHCRFKLLIMTDVIEHLSRNDGKLLLEQMVPTICRHLLIFTPTGELFLSPLPGPHSHRSGWSPEEFNNREMTVWEWPQFHHFPDGSINGAFFAWTAPVSVEQIAKDAGVEI